MAHRTQPTEPATSDPVSDIELGIATLLLAALIVTTTIVVPLLG